MLGGSLRRFDIQARYGFALSLISILPCLAAVGLLARNMEWELRQVVYRADGPFVPAYLGCILVSSIPAAVGLLLGLSSAGQRRNDKPAMSWVSFFVGGGILTVDVILVIALLMLRLPHTG